MGRQSFGTIDKRGTASKPRYRARFDDPTYTGPGRAPRISAPHTFPTKREAEIWLAAQWSAIAAGTWEHPAAIAAREAEEARQRSLRGLTVAEWADAWLVDLERTAAAGTLRKRRSDLRRHILPHLRDRELADLTSADLSHWWNALDATPGARRNAYETMRALLNAAASDERTLLTSSPLNIKGRRTRSPHPTKAPLLPRRGRRARGRDACALSRVGRLAGGHGAAHQRGIGSHSLVAGRARGWGDECVRRAFVTSLRQASGGRADEDSGGRAGGRTHGLDRYHDARPSAYPRRGRPAGDPVPGTEWLGIRPRHGAHAPTHGPAGRGRHRDPRWALRWLAHSPSLLGYEVWADGRDDARADDSLRLVRSGDGSAVPALR